MQNQLIRIDNLSLSSIIVDGTIKLIARVLQKPLVYSVYQGNLPTIEEDVFLSKYFQTTEDLLDHIKVKQNIQVDVDTMTVKIVARINTKKSKNVEIYQVKLSQIQRDFKAQLSKIVNFCITEEQIENNFIKQSIKIMAESLLEIIPKTKQQKMKQDTVFQKNQVEINQKLNIWKEEIKEQIQNFQDRIRKLQQKYKNQFQNFYQQNKDKISQSLNPINKTQHEQLFRQKLKNLAEHFHKIKTIIDDKCCLVNQQIKNPNYEVNRFYFKKFKIIGNQVQYIGQNKNTLYFFNKVIPFNQNYSFKLKITKGPYFIRIGILDYENNKNQRSSKKLYQFSYYVSGADGKAYKSPHIKEGNGFDLGDIVKVSVNLSMKTIQWYVNDKIQASIIDNMLEDKNITFMPFVEFYNKNSAVQWIDDR